LAGQSAAATIVTAGGVRSGSGTQSQTGGNAASADSLAMETTQPDEADGETEIIPGSTSKTTGIIPVTTQPGQSPGTAATSSAAAEPLVTAADTTKEMPALQDIAARGNDMPAQTNAPGANQTSATAAAFGSELKLAGDASPAGETAAARNAPNAAASQVAVQINRAVQDGQDKFVVNLKPGILGKVSIELEVGHDKRIIAVIAAERPETLDLLQRDSRALELALKDAGLKTDSGSLSFSLQGDGAKDSPFGKQPGLDHAIAVQQGGGDLDTLPTQNTVAYATDAPGIDIHV